MPLPKTVDGLPVIGSNEPVFETKDQLRKLTKRNDLAAITRVVKLFRGEGLPPTDLAGHLVDTEVQLVSLAQAGLPSPAHEWCYIPGSIVQEHYSYRPLLAPGFALGVRIERIAEKRKELSDYFFIREALATWERKNNEGIILADMNTKQVSKGSIGSNEGFWVHDIEPLLDEALWWDPDGEDETNNTWEIDV